MGLISARNRTGPQSSRLRSLCALLEKVGGVDASAWALCGISCYSIFSPSHSELTPVWLGLHLEFAYGFFPQLYGRHKEYLSSLVGTDFEMVSGLASCPTTSWL